MSEHEDPLHDTHSASNKHRIFSRVWWRSFTGKLTATVAIVASIASIIAAIPIITPLFQRPTPPEPPTELQRTTELALEFWEGGKNVQYPMTVAHKSDGHGEIFDVTRVAVKAEPFEIHFPTLTGGAGEGMHICAWTDDSIFNVKGGTNFNDMSDANASAFSSYFTPGKGISNTTAGDAILPITNKYNSYWVEDRVEHISNVKDRIFISKADDQLLTKQKTNLYLSIWIDKNVDNVIGLGEYEYFELDFPKSNS